MTENCVPACLSCNGSKGESEAFQWYRRQDFYDPRRAMALKAWTEGELRLAQRLLAWSQPPEQGRGGHPQRTANAHQTRQATTPLWRWQIAS